MNPVIIIPKGKSVLEFLQQLDGENKRTQNAWIFVHKDVIPMLQSELECTSFNKVSHELCYGLPHSVEDRYVLNLTLSSMCMDICDRHALVALWSLVTSIHCSEDSPIQIAFTQPSEFPSEVILLGAEA